MECKRDFRNFHKFPPSLQYPDRHLYPLCPVVHHIFNFHHVSRFLLQGCFKAYFDHSGYLGGAVSLIVAKPSDGFTVGNSSWFSCGNELRVPSDNLTFKQTYKFFEKFEIDFSSAKICGDIIFLHRFTILTLNILVILDILQIILHYALSSSETFDERATLLMSRATLSACYASRRLKRRKSEHDGAMFRKLWSWNVKEARGLRRRRMTMPWEKLD